MNDRDKFLQSTFTRVLFRKQKLDKKSPQNIQQCILSESVNTVSNYTYLYLDLY